MVDCHGEKKTTKHFDQCGSHDDKYTLFFSKFHSYCIGDVWRAA